MPAAKFKLFHCPATRSARVKWLLHELVGGDFDIEIVSLLDAEQYGPDYLRINPNHCVPVLEISSTDGDFIRMVESGAMVVFLADMFPDKKLAPPSADPSPGRADYLQTIHFCCASIDMMLWQIRIHEHILARHERDISTIERYRKKFSSEVEPQLKRRLELTGFASGSRFSAADCMIGHAVRWAKAYGMCSDAIFQDYLLRLSERPAYQSAFSDLHHYVRDIPQDSPVSGLFTG